MDLQRGSLLKTSTSSISHAFYKHGGLAFFFIELLGPTFTLTIDQNSKDTHSVLQKPTLDARTGKVVVLHLASGVAPIPALVLTLWPVGQKPRPCAQEIPLQCVKTFRAVHLQFSDSSMELIPTDYVWRYGPEQVVAILEVVEGNMSSGRFLVTPQSMAALTDLKGEDLGEPEVHKGHRLLKGGMGTSTEKKGPASKTRKPNRKMTFAKVRKRLEATAKASAKKKVFQEVDDPNKLEVVAAEIRRSQKGRKVIRDVLVRAVSLAKLHFGDSACFDLQTGACRVPECDEITEKVFLNHVASHFQYRYFLVRNAEHFGSRVRSDLSRILKQLHGEPPEQKLLEDLIRECKKTHLHGEVNLK